MYIFDSLRLKEMLLEPKTEQWYYDILIFIFFLPWNLIVISPVLAIAAIPATILTPFMVLPSYFLNTKSFFNIMRYWWGGNRFKGNVEEQYIKPKPPPKSANNKKDYNNPLIPDIIPKTVTIPLNKFPPSEIEELNKDRKFFVVENT
jgi:hypothetical protein